jgi:hypothetical protein
MGHDETSVDLDTPRTAEASVAVIGELIADRQQPNQRQC